MDAIESSEKAFPEEIFTHIQSLINHFAANCGALKLVGRERD
jgi:hypothetical protein